MYHSDYHCYLRRVQIPSSLRRSSPCPSLSGASGLCRSVVLQAAVVTPWAGAGAGDRRLAATHVFPFKARFSRHLATSPPSAPADTLGTGLAGRWDGAGISLPHGQSFRFFRYFGPQLPLPWGCFTWNRRPQALQANSSVSTVKRPPHLGQDVSQIIRSDGQAIRGSACVCQLPRRLRWCGFLPGRR